MNAEIENKSHPALVLGEIGLIRNLGEAGITVYTGTEVKDNPFLYSRYNRRSIRFSDYGSPEFIEELCSLGETLNRKAVIFSDDDRAILNISQHQERLKKYFLFTFPPAGTVQNLLDKQQFCGLIDQYDLPAPRSITLSSLSELTEKRMSGLRYPCIIKPSFKQAWWNNDFGDKVGDYQKAIKCNSYDDLVLTYGRIAQISPHVVVQEFIEGDEDQIYSVNMFIDERGKLKGYFIARKLRTYPVKAGEGSYIKTVRDDEMITMARDIAGKMRLTGLLNVQFKRDQRSGKPVILEIHTRNSVWSYLGTAAGVNLAALYYHHLTGREQRGIPAYKEGVAFIFMKKDIRAFIQNLKRRHLSSASWLASYFKRFETDHKLNDPLPLLMSIYFFIKRRFHLKPIKHLFTRTIFQANN